MVYGWLLCLYPGSYRSEFGDEMTSIFRQARSALPPALVVKISFTNANIVDSYWEPCVHTLTDGSDLAFHSGDSICKPSFAFPAPACS
jgi:hypothetical protein